MLFLLQKVSFMEVTGYNVENFVMARSPGRFKSLKSISVSLRTILLVEGSSSLFGPMDSINRSNFRMENLSTPISTLTMVVIIQCA